MANFYCNRNNQNWYSEPEYINQVDIQTINK
jgi:hypothetical protein